MGYSAQQSTETSLQEASCCQWHAVIVGVNGETRPTNPAKTAIVCGNAKLNTEVA